MGRVIARIKLWQETVEGKEHWLQSTGRTEEQYEEWLRGAHARYAEYMDERGFRYRGQRRKPRKEKKVVPRRRPKKPTQQMLQWEQEMLAKLK